jgi:hypothetical protein
VSSRQFTARRPRLLAPGAAGGPAGPASRRTPGRPQPGGWRRAAVTVARRHWLAGLLLSAGLVLRVITQLAYRPPLLYIDSLKYLYGAWIGADPLGYKVPLKVLLAVGNLGTVEFFQHLLGLAMAVLLYVLLLRRGVHRWLAALAIAPVLLDAYQLQAEATIMPDVFLEALVVLALAVLLWRPEPSWPTAVVTGLILGAGVTVREVGLALIVPAVLYLLLSRGPSTWRTGWPGAISRSIALCAAFVLPIFAYCCYAEQATGHFSLSVKGSAAGRMAQAADCATLRLPAAVRQLCPTPAEQKESPDWLITDSQSPLLRFAAPGTKRQELVSVFDKAVERQQPLRVVTAILRDSIRIFEVNRTDSEAITPITRWQFQDSYPVYAPEVTLRASGLIVVGVQYHHTSPYHYGVLSPAYGGRAQVDRPLASLLRGYQLHGGFTPGPLLLLFTLAGLAGSLLALLSRRTSGRGREAALACLAIFVAGAALLLVADLYVFSWRYQLPALITLPPAGVLGVSALLEAMASRPRRGARRDSAAAPAPVSSAL